MKKNTKRAGIVGGVVATLVGGGVAFAAFTGTGTFTAAGQVAQAPKELTGTGTVGELYPGGCADVQVTFSNPNDHAATVEPTRASMLLTSLAITGDKVVRNPNAVLPAGATSFTVPKGGQNTITVAKAVCLSGSATNDNAGEAVSVSATVPFTFANDTDYKG